MSDNLNMKGLIASLERKNGMTSSIDNDDISIGRLNTDIVMRTNITLEGPVTCLSTLNVSGVTTINNTMNAMEVKQQYQSSPIAFALLVPTGSIMPYAGSSAPNGWLLCNGDEVSRTTYSALYDAIGDQYTYGCVDDDKFNLPDLRGRVPLGAGAGSGLSERTLGATGGQESINQVPPHTHNSNAGSGQPMAIVERSNTITGSSSDATGNEYNPFKPIDLEIKNTGDNISTGAVDIMNPFLVLNYIIKY
jgi:microcystin-dependent protein